MNHRGNSIVEVMVVMVIVTTGIIGTYRILDSGQKLASTSENRIKAINIAREGIEAVENIRDTNWIKFSSDYNNCWRVKDYNPTCIGSITPPSFLSGSNILVQSWSLWYLSGVSNPSTTYTGLLSQFPIFLDPSGLISATGSSTRCTTSRSSDCKTAFTREIIISYPTDPDHMKVTSIVHWADSTKTSWMYTVHLETTLTNWKKNF